LYIFGGVLALIIVLAVIGWFMEVYESIRSLFTRNGTTNRISVSKTAEPANMKSVKHLMLKIKALLPQGKRLISSFLITQNL
jgi:hypothetical protein